VHTFILELSSRSRNLLRPSFIAMFDCVGMPSHQFALVFPNLLLCYAVNSLYEVPVHDLFWLSALSVVK